MKLYEVIQLIKPNEIARRSPEMTTPNVYKKENRGIGKKTNVKTEKVTVKDSKTGKEYGHRTVVQ
jgi:hypothetical protein